MSDPAAATIEAGRRVAPASPGTKEFVAIVASCIGMAALSIDVMLPAFPEIREELGLAGDSSAVAALVTSFFVGLAAGQVIYGPLSDRFGRKPVLYAGLVVFLIGAVGATLAPSLATMVAARLVWGAGAAAPRSLALAMVRDAYEGERMVRTMSIVMTVFMVVPIFAPALGAVALTFAPWRVVFWIPAVAALALALWLLRLPETLAPEARRAVSPAALVDAFRVVVGTRQTLACGLAVTFLFSIMVSYVAGAELLIEDVFDRGELFPVIFGLLACTLAVGSLLSARLVQRFGLEGLLRAGAIQAVAASAGLAALALVTGGRPPLWLFGVSIGLLLPAVTLLVPSCNTLAMAPVPHVAGMASAVLGTISTGGAALIGTVVGSAYDGTIRPFALSALVLAVLAAGAITVALRAVGPPASVEHLDPSGPPTLTGPTARTPR